MKTGEICVIGIGNEYRGDDAVGLLAARQLKGKGLSDAAIFEMDGETTALMEAMNNHSHVILIDAVQSGSRVGTVTRFDAGTHPLPSADFRCSTHAISLSETIELARALGKLPCHVIVYGIEGSRFEPGSAVSPEVVEALMKAVEQVSNEIKLIQTQPPRPSGPCLSEGELIFPPLQGGCVTIPEIGKNDRPPLPKEE